MGSLSNARDEIWEHMIQYKAQLESDLKVVESSISDTLVVFAEAKAEGDTSENAAYTDAIDSLNILNQQKASILNSIENIESLLANNESYVPSGSIKVGSTFSIERSDTGEKFTLRVCKGSVSNIRMGIMSTDSRFYREAVGKRSGQVVNVRHAVTGQMIEFRILEVL